MSIHQLLAADKNLSEDFRRVFCEQTHTSPAPQEYPHTKAMAAIEAAIRQVQACDAPRFDCSIVLEQLHAAKGALGAVYFDDEGLARADARSAR